MIKDTSKKAKRISPLLIATALGADSIGNEEYNKKLQAFKDHAKSITEIEPDDTIDVILISGPEYDGFLTISKDAERTDNCCEQCQKEFLVYRFAGDDDFPYTTLSAIIGPTKWEKIQSGNHDIEIPDNLKIGKSLL